MFLARVVGRVWSTVKEPRLEGRKLLVVRHVSPEGADEATYAVALDAVSAGFREKVLTVAGGSARFAAGLKDCPVDAVIVGIVDNIELDGTP